MLKNIEIVTGGMELLDSVKPLWEKLNTLHAEMSKNFSKSYQEWTFEDRKNDLIVKAEDNKLKVDLAFDREHEKNVGYCVSTIDEKNIGEIDSIFVEEKYRDHGLGEELMKSTLRWLDDQRVEEKYIAVAAGNEKAFKFYERFGFYPRRTVLSQLPKT